MTRTSRLAITVLAAVTLLLIVASSASAITLGVGWSGVPEYNNAEMGMVEKSGATTFRVPFGGGFANQAVDDSLVLAAAEHNVTIHAEVSSGVSALPQGSARTEFLNWVHFAVERYGYNGKFWEDHPGLTPRPITTWEVWNEPNLHGIGAAEYGQFLNEVANSIQAGSQAKAGRNTEVLFGGLMVWGNTGTGTAAYYGALKYLQQAYPYFGSNGNVTGVAIHPYELDPTTFFKPENQPRYGRLEAFEYALGGFHTKLVELAEGSRAPQKSLWITEVGWPAENEWGVGEASQATLLGQAVDYVRNNEGWLNAKDFLWYNFRDSTDTGTNWANWCGLRAHNGHFRDAWFEFQRKAGAGLWPRGTSVFQSNNNQLVTMSDVGESNWGQGMLAGTSPSIAAVSQGYEMAFQANTGQLVSVGDGGSTNWGQGMAAGTSPDITALSNNGYEMAFQANTNQLITMGTSGGTNWGQGMKPNTSPAITTLSNGGIQMAFQANTGNLITIGNATSSNTGLGMMGGTSPDITALSFNGYEMAFQANNGQLWFAGTAGNSNTGLGMMAGTSPSITTLTNGGYEVSFQSNAGQLWTWGTAGSTDWGKSMAPGTSPSIDLLG
jgi:hypothetical protein